MRKIHTPNPDMYKSYYLNQAQHGGGNLPAFHGARFQRGNGIGSFLKGLFRSAVPFLREGAKSVGKTALATGMNIANDVMTRKNLKSSARTRFNEAKGKLKDQAIDVARNVVGQSGKGIKRRASSKSASHSQTKRRKTSAPKSRGRKPKQASTRKRVIVNDIFG